MSFPLAKRTYASESQGWAGVGVDGAKPGGSRPAGEDAPWPRGTPPAGPPPSAGRRPACAAAGPRTPSGAGELCASLTSFPPAESGGRGFQSGSGESDLRWLNRLSLNTNLGFERGLYLRDVIK